MTEQEPYCFGAAWLHHSFKSLCSDLRSYKTGANPKSPVCILDIKCKLLPPISHTSLHVTASVRQYTIGELFLTFYWKRQNQTRTGMCWTSIHVARKSCLNNYICDWHQNASRMQWEDLGPEDQILLTPSTERSCPGSHAQGGKSEQKHRCALRSRCALK